MRELIYLSNAKIAEFLPPAPRWWQRLGHQAKVELGTPLGKVGLEMGAASADVASARLDKIIEHIATSASWFTDSNLQPGQWVEFQARMNYAAISSISIFGITGQTRLETYEGHTGPAVFLSVPDDLALTDTRLLLHGSSAHLTGATLSSVPVQSHLRYSSEVYIIDWLKSQPVDPLPERQPNRMWGTDSIQQTMLRTIHSLDSAFDPAISTWVAGYARLTSVSSREIYFEEVENSRKYQKRIWNMLSATPLYVERIPPPIPLPPDSEGHAN